MSKRKKHENTPAPDDQTPETEDVKPDEATEQAPEVVVEEPEEAPDYQALYEESKEKILRQYAEFENYRKRSQREFGAIRSQTKAGTIEEFLPIYDHFGMALSHSDQDDSVLRQGMEMILAEFRRTFENLGVEELDAVGKPFDPDLHEAMAQEPSEDVPEGHVIRQWKAGFLMGEKLLRPATVVVSAGPQTEEAAKDNAATKE